MSMKRSLSPESQIRHRQQYPLQKQKSVSDIIGPMITELDLTQGAQSLTSLAEANKQAVFGRLGINGGSSTAASSSQNSRQSSPDAETSTNPSDIPWPTLPRADDSEISKPYGENLSATSGGISGANKELSDEREKLSAEKEKLTVDSGKISAEHGELSAAIEELNATIGESSAANGYTSADASSMKTSGIEYDEQMSATVGDLSDLSPEQLIDDLTDVDGRLTDALCTAAKKGAKLTKKGMELVADDIETVYRGTKFYAHKAAEDVVDAGVGLEDALGTVMNRTVNRLGGQHAVEESLGNNVYLMHPTYGAADMVPMGMNIEKVHFYHGSGYQIRYVEPGRLAHQASLRQDDVIIAIDETDVVDISLEQILCIFGTISTTFSMTVVRRVPDEELDIPQLVKNIITVEVHVNDDEAVAITLLDVRCEMLAYNGPSNDIVHIAHRHLPTNELFYMSVTNGMVGMCQPGSQQPSLDECQFKLNLYTPRVNNGCGNTCSLSNVSSNKALAIKEENNSHAVCVDSTNGLTSSDPISVDLRFFHRHPQRNDSSKKEFGFESSQSSKKGLFLAFEYDADDSTKHLKLIDYSGDVATVPAQCKFIMFPVDN